MNNTNALLQHPEYQTLLKELEAFEAERIYCKHSLEHFMDVARITYIHCLEDGLDISKDLIYYTALLHDIGRVEEYRNNVPHDKASIEIAQMFLKESTFSSAKQRLIIEAIAGHRHKEAQDMSVFATIFAQADRESRLCMNCPAIDLCYWPAEKKNQIISY